MRREVSLNERGHIAKQFATEMREGCEREWTMEDIDAEIAAARKDRKVRKSQSTTPSQNSCVLPKWEDHREAGTLTSRRRREAIPVAFCIKRHAKEKFRCPLDVVRQK